MAVMRWQDGFLAILGDAASSIVCGGLAGTVMWAAVLPIDVAKTRIQTATPGTPRDVGVLRNLAMMYGEGVLLHAIVCSSICAYASWCMAVVYTLLDFIQTGHGLMLTDVNWPLLYYCMHPVSKEVPQEAHSGTGSNAAAVLCSSGGRAALYAGLRPTLIRAFPANAAQWFTWECCMRWMHNIHRFA